jgi:hypothetical protein
MSTSLRPADHALGLQAVDAIGHRAGGQAAGVGQFAGRQAVGPSLPAQCGEHVVLPPLKAVLQQPFGRPVAEDFRQRLDAQHDAHGSGIQFRPLLAPVGLQFVDDVAAHGAENTGN